MSKIKITEEQYKKLMDLNEVEEIQEIESVEEIVDLYENVSQTFGNLEVRNLIAEGNEIKGEVKSSYGIWGKMTWDLAGNSKTITENNVFKKLSYRLELINEAGPVPMPVGASNNQMNVPSRSSQTGGNGQVNQAQANNLTIANDVKQIYSFLKKQGATVKLYASGYVIQSSDLGNPENVYLTYNNNLFSVYIRYSDIGKPTAQNYINMIQKQFPNYQLDGQQKDNGQQLLASFIPKTNRNGGSVVTENV